MIKNERQYRVTKAQLRAFEESLRQISKMPAPSGVNPKLMSVAQAAFTSQREELQAAVEEYEALQRGDVSRFVAESVGELPPILIKARIALGLTQRELATRLGIKEQQVQRWEATDYENATIETLKQVINALGVETREELFVPTEQVSPEALLRNLTSAGLPRQFLLRRLLPSHTAALFEDGTPLRASLRDILQAASAISRVFGASVSNLLSTHPTKLAFAGIAATRFKLSARSPNATLNAYTIYAHYLAALVESCAEPAISSTFQTDPHAFHEALTQPAKPMCLGGTLEYLWSHNVIVLPLLDEGAFHGALWKIRGRYVIVLKQKTLLESRWLYDLLHEVGHAACGHVTGEEAIVEDGEISPEARGTEEEQANEWAEDALFDGDSELIEDACARACGGRLQRLNEVIPGVATRFNVNMGSLANHMAFRLAAQGENWWGAAHNVQIGGSDPYQMARELLLRRINLRKLSPVDRDLLMRALTEG